MLKFETLFKMIESSFTLVVDIKTLLSGTYILILELIPKISKSKVYKLNY